MKKFFHYPACSTCKKARKWLEAEGLFEGVEALDIVQTPPSRQEIEAAWRASGLDLKRFFNTSGQSYRDLDLKNTYASRSDEERLDLLAADGKLIKRPLLILSDAEGTPQQVCVGFKQEEWQEARGALDA